MLPVKYEVLTFKQIDFSQSKVNIHCKILSIIQHEAKETYRITKLYSCNVHLKGNIATIISLLHILFSFCAHSSPDASKIEDTTNHTKKSKSPSNKPLPYSVPSNEKSQENDSIKENGDSKSSPTSKDKKEATGIKISKNFDINQKSANHHSRTSVSNNNSKCVPETKLPDTRSTKQDPADLDHKKKTASVTNFLSKEKKETLRRLLSASETKEIKSPLFTRQKVDSYKLSHTCLIDDDASDNNQSMSRSSSNSRSRSRSLSKTRDSNEKKPPIVLASHEDPKSLPSSKNTSRSKSRDRSECNENKNLTNKSPSKCNETSTKFGNKSPIISSQFRKLSKQELGKTNLRTAVNENPTLPLLVDTTPKTNKQTNSFVVNRQNGLLPKPTGALLPTPVR